MHESPHLMTTKVYPLRCFEEEGAHGIAEIGHIPLVGCGDFLARLASRAKRVTLRYASVAVAWTTALSASLADTRKLLATRAGDIFEMGSKVLKINKFPRGGAARYDD